MTGLQIFDLIALVAMALSAVGILCFHMGKAAQREQTWRARDEKDKRNRVTQISCDNITEVKNVLKGLDNLHSDTKAIVTYHPARAAYTQTSFGQSYIVPAVKESYKFYVQIHQDSFDRFANKYAAMDLRRKLKAGEM